MKKLVLFGVIALVLFAASFATSYFWQRNKSGTEQAGGGEGTQPGDREAAKTGARTSEPSPEEAAKLAASLRERLGSLQSREADLAARQKELDLVAQDIRSQRTEMEKLQKDLLEELKKIREKLDKGALSSTEPKSPLDEFRRRILEERGAERANLRKLAEMLQNMAPEDAAVLLKELAATNKMDTAVRLLAEIPERLAAKILAELEFCAPQLPALLVEKLRKLKHPGQTEELPEPKPAIPEKLPPPRPEGAPPKPSLDVKAQGHGRPSGGRSAVGSIEAEILSF
jgi:flagellar motility protein MotE (MotC chaperone)